MFAADFNVGGADTALATMLQEYEGRQGIEEVHHGAPEADCHDDLGSHIDTPIQRGKFEGQDVYLIQWKLCWTPQSNIDCLSSFTGAK